ncbi:TauD/TfdA dioxygenase family protein [Tsuneonella sp. HG222]
MEVRPLHPLFAAELVGADLTVPPSSELVDTVESAMARFGVLAIRDARITDEQHKTFSRAFGPLEIPSRVPGAARPVGTRVVTPGMFMAGNLDHNGQIIPYGSDPKSLAKGAERFHTDSRQMFFAPATQLFHSTSPALQLSNSRLDKS